MSRPMTIDQWLDYRRGLCPGRTIKTGTQRHDWYDAGGRRWWRGECEHCGKRVVYSRQTGRPRSHKPPKACRICGGDGYLVTENPSGRRPVACRCQRDSRCERCHQDYFCECKGD